MSTFRINRKIIHRYCLPQWWLLSSLLYVIGAGACTSQKEALSQQPSWADAYSVDVAEVEGIQLRYLTADGGPPLLLIHTIRTQLDYFQWIIPELAKHYTVYAIDLPGHGQSELVDSTYQHALFHNTVKQFIRQKSLENVTIVGESIGGSLALTLAADDDLALKEVFALNPYDYEEKNGAGLKRSNGLSRFVFTLVEWPIFGWVAIRMEAKFVVRKILAGGFYDRSQLPETMVDFVRATGKRKHYKKAELAYFRAWPSWVAARKHYANIKTPTTLIYAEQDWSDPADRAANKRAIPHAKHIEIKQAGHFSSVEKPEEVLAIVLGETVR